MSTITLPGLIDVHVHLRDPGQTEKEDFYTGTSAALAGGFTTVIDMPNNKLPITTLKRLQEKIESARKKTMCNIGFYAGSLGDNLEELKVMEPYVKGLKLYLNRTTGNFLINKETLERIFSFWKSEKPILVHGEEDILPEILALVRHTHKRIHVCHVSKKSELSSILAAKKEGLPVTCGVTPHHLFLTQDDVKNLGSYALMKPELGTKSDNEYLWSHLSDIDVIESDHAPHTSTEKQSQTPPFGVPNLDTTLPLLLTAVNHTRLTMDEVIRLCYTNPASLFNIPTDENSKVEIDLAEEYTITKSDLKTKCAWTPFFGWKMKGRVKKVFLRGKKVFENGKLLCIPGSGTII
jgi:carbamoyl-phosphate synthase/aspartate carbamoyltransferase/dihydroorotase